MRTGLAPAAALFNGLADPARLAILRLLMSGEKNVASLTDELGLAQSTVSQHLLCLRECDLVVARTAGRASVYSIAHPELIDTLVAAEKLLAACGDTVTLCKTYGRAGVEVSSTAAALE